MEYMNRRQFLSVLAGGITAIALPKLAFSAKEAAGKKNVLFIAVDDMNDWTAGLGGYAGKAKTPSQDRLASRGVLFTNAHCPSTVCNPSRTAIMTGLQPSTTGIYGNSQWWKPALPDVVTIPEYFMTHGYRAEGGGKIFHHTPGFNPPSCWDKYFQQVFDNPWQTAGFSDARYKKYGYSAEKPKLPPWVPLNQIKPYNPGFDWGSLNKEESNYGDAKMVDWATDFLGKPHDKPFFLAAGVFRPHLPWYVPRKYFDMYPLKDIKLPVVPEDDMDDIPKEGLALARAREADRKAILKFGKWKEAIQAYLASISFADAQVGRLLDALDASEYADNTVIVFWSDHGWHLGEKHHWHKFTLWEECTRVPFIIVAPDISLAGTRCSAPVGLIDIYPTLIDICGLTPKKELDGRSLVPLLKNPGAKWKYPAITEYKRGQCAVRSERWRYIRYRDGSEELYDHDRDRDEWTNLAGRPEYASVKQELARWIPKQFAPDAPSKDAYEFDSDNYTWSKKK